MEFSVDTTELSQNLAEFPGKVRAAIEMYGVTASKTLQAQAKRNRPWTDRTTRARQGLTGSCGVEGTHVKIVLAHTVDYGLWLELAHEKNWAIVEPTVRLEQGNIFNGLEHLIDKIKL